MRRLALHACALALMLFGANRPAQAATDIVLYATDATNIHGNWSLVSDSSAAGGQLLNSVDNGWSSTSNPLASPGDYFEFTFSAPAATSYHVWLRLRAGANSKYNDSVYAQFSDSVNGSGSGVFRIGTTSGLTVNLQSCNGCGLSGWGWIDGGYWLSQSNPLSFSGSSTHTLRIQTREDGVQFDQVVLSPATYLSSAPGSVTDDDTIVPKPSSGGTTGSGSSTPFFGSAFAIPGSIAAQDFDNGGEGVAYHDTTPGNTGGAYRSTDVDLEPSSDGGNDVGWIDAGEWLNYTVNVASAGTYTVTFRVASYGPGGSFHLVMNGVNVSGTLTIPDTGGWQNWQTLTKSMSLSAGSQIARIVMDSGGPNGPVGNINSMQFAQSSSGGSGGGASSSTPYTGTPAAIPGTIQAENFDNGGEGVAYHDTTSGNSGGAYRSTDVDLEPASGGGYDVGWIDTGEWLNYTVNVASAGTYTVTFNVASYGQGGSFHLEMNGSNVSGSLTIPNTGGWQNWQTVSATVSLGAGQQVARIVMDSPGTYAVGNIDWFRFAASSGGGATVTVPAGGDLQAAINAAQPGDTILLLPGVTYAGTFTLPVKSGGSYITIRSAAPDSNLPPAGTRITPQYESQLPIVQGGFAGMPAFMTDLGAHHYRLLFLEITSTYVHNDIIELGDGSTAQNTTASIAHDLVVDRCYIHGDPTNGQKRGISLNSASTSIVNSYIASIMSTQEDSQAIGGWNGPGPYTITNNYLEAAGENIMFGGSDPAIANLVPSDITIQGNYITKQTSWMGQGWIVKNLIELKNAQRVVIDGNTIENCWAQSQVGFALMLTPRNQNGTAPWSVVQQVQVTNNIVRHVGSAVDILATDGSSTYTVTNNIVVRNNLITDVSSTTWGGSGQLLLIQGGATITFDHNTVMNDGTSTVYADVTDVTGFAFTNNIIPDNAWAVMGSGASEGNGTLAMYFPGATFQRNVLVAGNSALYPSGNYFPASWSNVGFVNLSGGNYQLASTSPYYSAATDGSAIGCNISALTVQ